MHVGSGARRGARWAAVAMLAAHCWVALPAGGGAASDARTIRVANASQFAAAVAALDGTGGTIVLRARVYRDELVVPPRTGPWLRIVAPAGARIERLRLESTQRVSIRGVTVTPFARDAWIHAERSRHVVLEDIRVTAAGTRFGASVLLPESNFVTIRHSEFTHCGDRSPVFVNCLALRWVSHLTVEDSWFHDCFGCDFIHGRFGSHLTLRRNRFERALPCTMGRIRCGHQDLVELFRGSHLLVEDNHFGVYRIGGAQLYFTFATDHVRVRNNVFIGTDPRVPGYRARVAMIIGSRGYRRVPHDVRVVNNTILTGARRVDGYEGSIRMSSMYGIVPRHKRPVLANNVIGVLEVPSRVCSTLGRSVRNVVLRGKRCSRSDRIGAAHLDARGRPTAASRLLIDRASGRYAPARDATGRPRGRRPDIGAYEFGR